MRSGRQICRRIRLGAGAAELICPAVPASVTPPLISIEVDVIRRGKSRAGSRSFREMIILARIAREKIRGGIGLTVAFATRLVAEIIVITGKAAYRSIPVDIVPAY